MCRSCDRIVSLRMMVDYYYYYYTLIAVLLCSSSIMAVEQNSTCARYGFDIDNPGASCADIFDNNPASHGKSDYYVIKTDRIHTVYCDMELECGGQRGGWMKSLTMIPVEEMTVP